MPAQTGPAIALSNVSKAFGGTIALDSVSLTIAAGSFVALVGQSGSGKSTLLKTINRLVAPDRGSVTIDDAPVDGAAAHLLRRRIGYVFQSIGLFPHMSVAENIAIGLRIAGQRETGARVAELLTLVDLPGEVAERTPDQLSGGQRQRIGVARALATAPGCLLMDEPFGALDPVTRDDLGRAVRALHERLALTTVMVTHDMAEALLLADRVLVMQAGRIVADASPAALARGEGGPEAQALIAVPMRQADALEALKA